MRILHTADWHLGDRLKHVDRSADLRAAVERIARYCDQYRVDVLLIAGDWFSDLARPDVLRASIAHVSELFRPFLLRGGTIVALTGNHDNDVFCETLRRAFQLAAPIAARAGDLLLCGRLYLATTPVHFRLADCHQKHEVQWVCMPYPTTGRYLRGAAGSAYQSFRHRNQLLQEAFTDQLRAIREKLRPEIPSVLAGHVNVIQADCSNLFRLNRQDDVTVDDRDVIDGWTYVALGHLHRPQIIDQERRARYSGSIERLDIGEQSDSKSVVLLDIGPNGLAGEPVALPMDPTPFHDVRIRDPRRDLQQLRSRYPDASRALVRCHVDYYPGEDNLYEILAELARIFPRCYQRTWSPRRRSSSGQVPGSASTARISPAERDNSSLGIATVDRAMPTRETLDDTILQYLQEELAHDPDREVLLEMARSLLEETS